MENNYGEKLTSKLNSFTEKSYYVYLMAFLCMISFVSIYIRIFLLKYTIFNFINLGIGIFACFLVLARIKTKESTSLSNKSILLILLLVLTYNIIFGMIGFPILQFIPFSFFNNFLLYTLLSYVFFIYFFIKEEEKYSRIFLNIFLILSAIDLILPFILLLSN